MAKKKFNPKYNKPLSYTIGDVVNEELKESIKNMAQQKSSTAKKTISSKVKKMSAGERKALERANKVMDFSRKYGNNLLIGTGVALGVATVADHLMDKSDESRARIQQVKQEKQFEEQIKKANMPPQLDHVGLAQQLWNSRSGHSNTWGGRKY